MKEVDAEAKRPDYDYEATTLRGKYESLRVRDKVVYDLLGFVAFFVLTSGIAVLLFLLVIWVKQ